MLMHYIHEILNFFSNFHLDTLVFFPIAFGFTSQAGQASPEQVRAALEREKQVRGVDGRMTTQQQLWEQQGARGPQRGNYGYGPVDVNKLQGYNMMRQLAGEKGPSQASQYSLQQNLLNRQNTIDQGVQQQAGAYNQSLSDMASRGGVGGGSRERLSQFGMKNSMLNKQGAYRDAGSSMMDILKQDAATKAKAMGDFSGLEQSYVDKNQQTIKDIYGEDRAMWGAKRQAGDVASEFYNSGLGGENTGASGAYNQNMFSAPQGQQPYNMMNSMQQPTGGMGLQGGPVGPKLGKLPTPVNPSNKRIAF